VAERGNSDIKIDAEYLLLCGFGNRIKRYWSMNVGERKDNPCGRAIESALGDYIRWCDENRHLGRRWKQGPFREASDGL
jgi:hypothetical protein